MLDVTNNPLINLKIITEKEILELINRGERKHILKLKNVGAKRAERILGYLEKNGSLNQVRH